MEGLWYDGLTRWQQAFFVLLRCGLWETAPCVPSLFPLSEGEWKMVYDESRRQTVQGLLFRGFQQLPEQLFPPQALVMRWLADTAAAEQTYRQSVEATRRTWRLLHGAGLKPVLQKGLAVGMHYEHPEERVYGDVDWHVADMAAAEELLRSQGIDSERRADESLSFYCHNTVVELHPQLIDLQNPGHAYALGLLLDDGQPVLQTVAPDITVSTPSVMQTLVMLQAHILKHVVTVGIGLRQFCDLARAYHVLHRRADDGRLIEYYCRLDMLRWTQLTHTFLYHYLGMPAQELPCLPDAPQNACLRLARAVLRWGNFGQHTATWQSALSLPGLHTATQIVRNLPFALHYAPVETAHKIKNLIKHHS